MPTLVIHQDGFLFQTQFKGVHSKTLDRIKREEEKTFFLKIH